MLAGAPEHLLQKRVVLLQPFFSSELFETCFLEVQSIGLIIKNLLEQEDLPLLQSISILTTVISAK